MKIRLYFLMAIFLILAPLNILRSQGIWTWRNPIPQGNMLYDVFFVDDLQGWAVGGRGMILHTTDGGQTWTIQSGSTTNTLKAISFPTTQVGYISGKNVILKSIDAGKTWQLLPTISHEGKVLFFVDEKTGWSGSGSAFWLTTDGGLTWEMHNMPDPYWVNGLYFVDKLVGFWAGFGGLHKTSDGGKSWQLLWNLPMIYQYHDVWFFDHSNGFAVGSSGTIIKTTDGGNTWTQLAKLGGGSGYRLHFKNPNLGWAIHNGGGIYRTENGGQTWTSVNTDRFYDVWFPSTTGYAVGENGKMFKSIDNGTTWLPCYQRLQSDDFRFPFFNDPQHGWLLGDDNRMYTTEDGGRSWIFLSQPDITYFSRLVFLDRNIGWITADSKLMNSLDGGVTWQTRFTHDYKKFYDIQFAGANTGWAVGENIMNTTNAGQSWKEQRLPDHSFFEGIQFPSVCFVNEQKGWLVGYKDSDYLAYKTQNGGENWTKMVIPSPAKYKLIRFADERQGYILSEKAVYRTTDAGETWSVCFQNEHANLSDMSVISARQVRIAAGGMGTLESAVLCTDDGGQTWYEDQLPLDRTPRELYLSDANNGVVICGSSILQYQGSAPIPAFATGLTATALTDKMITVDWQDNATNETGYYVFRSDCLAGRFKLYDSLAVDSRHYEDIKVAPRTVYWYRVAPYNSNGRSGWSQEDSARTPAFIPAAPELLEPADGATTTTLNPFLSWTSVTGSVSYQLQVATNQGFSSVVIDQSDINALNIVLNTLTVSTEYYWRVRAIGATDAGLWSTVRHFQTPGLVAPLLVAPANGEAQAINLPLLQWAAVPSAISYYVQVALDQSFTNLVVNDSSQTESSWRIGPLSFQTTYFWRVAVKLTAAKSSWSAVWQFTTLPASALLPATPTLRAPNNGAINQPIDLNLGWHVAERAVYYQLQMAVEMNFNSIIRNVDQIVNISYRAESLPYNTLIYWRVRAFNSSGVSSWSAVFSFTTVKLFPPLSPKLVSPSNQVENIAIPALLQWNPSSFAASYHLQVSTDFTFGSTVLDTNLTNTSCLVNKLANRQTYYWRVSAINAGGGSSWTLPFDFKTIAPQPQWLLMSSGATAYLGDLWFTDQHKGWVVGDSGLILHTVDGGDSWKKQSSLTSKRLRAIFFINDRIAWVVGNQGIVLKSNDGGQSWQPQTPFTTNTLSTVFFTTPNTGWISGSDGLFYTTNGGLTWIKKEGMTKSTSLLNFYTHALAWCVQLTGVSKSEDAGSKWILQTPQAAVANSMFIVNENNVWLTDSYNHLYVTRNGGSTWDMIMNYESNQSIAFIDSLHGWRSSFSGIKKTVDAGVNWVEDPRVESTTNIAEGRLFFVGAGDSLYGWSAGLYGTILRTQKLRGDLLFKPVMLSPENGVTALPAAPLLQWQSCNGAQAYRLQITADPSFKNLQKDTVVNATTWQSPVLTGGTFYYWRVMALAGNNKSLWSFPWQFQMAGASKVTQLNQPESFWLGRNYPNPANPVTTIEYEIPKTVVVELKIFDLLGHEVAMPLNGVQSAGRHRVAFSVEHLKSGVYWYRLFADNRTLTGKMIVLK